MKRLLTGLGLALLAMLLLIQLVPVSRANPPVEADMPAPAEVKAILRTSCYDCHSNETHWELPAYVAPFSWLISRDVREGRAELNFSTWNRGGESAAEAPGEILETVAEGEMPPPLYFLTHPEAKLSPAQLAILRDWAGAQPGAGDPAGEGARGGRGGHNEAQGGDDDDDD